MLYRMVMLPIIIGDP